MQPLWRILIASALAFAGTAVLAQNAPTDAPPTGASSPPADPIGPPQLSNFSLGGKVTQPAQQPTEIQPTQQQPRAPRASQTPLTTDASPAPATKAPTRVQTAERPSVRASSQPAAEPSAGTGNFPSAIAAPPPQAAPTSSLSAVAEHAPAPPRSRWFSALLWLLAAAVAAGAAAWYFLWQRPRTQLAPAGIPSAFDAPAPESLRPAPPPPQTASPSPKSTGVVSARLRPWVELQFTPGRVILDGEKAVLEFEMSLFNSGSAPARDVLVEGALFNAGPMQDQQISAFFQNPIGQGNRLPLLAPLQRLSINSAITLSRAQLVPLEMEGRPLLVPLAGFNALYRWGNGSDGQTSTSYLVGKQTNGEKLAPFRLDMAPRVFRRLAAREYELRVRQ